MTQNRHEMAPTTPSVTDKPIPIQKKILSNIEVEKDILNPKYKSSTGNSILIQIKN